VTVSSDAHYQAPGIDFTALRRRARGVTGMPAYAVAKLCNVLFSQELARRLDGQGVTSYALHPGVVSSNIWRRVPWPVRPIITKGMLSIDQGAATSLYCATDPGAGTQNRPLLRAFGRARAERRGHPGTRPDPVGAQRSLDRILITPA